MVSGCDDVGAGVVANVWVEPKGVLLHDCQMCETAPHASNPEFAERLWKLSEELVKQEFRF